jgi:septal ring factor EnvC (AmiA/AmiB activator)
VVRSTPIRGPIVDPWRPPSTPYGPGNLGVDIGARAGAIVVSPADGVISFAGAVGNSRFVVVASSDGIRITVGFLVTVRVRTGQIVRRGQPIGTAGRSVHVGARIGDDYVDPTPLFSGGPPHVRLVPTGSSPPRRRG